MVENKIVVDVERILSQLSLASYSNVEPLVKLSSVSERTEKYTNSRPLPDDYGNEPLKLILE